MELEEGNVSTVMKVDTLHRTVPIKKIKDRGSSSVSTATRLDTGRSSVHGAMVIHREERRTLKEVEEELRSAGSSLVEK